MATHNVMYIVCIPDRVHTLQTSDFENTVQNMNRNKGRNEMQHCRNNLSGGMFAQFNCACIPPGTSLNPMIDMIDIEIMSRSMSRNVKQNVNQLCQDDHVQWWNRSSETADTPNRGYPPKFWKTGDTPLEAVDTPTPKKKSAPSAPFLQYYNWLFLARVINIQWPQSSIEHRGHTRSITWHL